LVDLFAQSEALRIELRRLLAIAETRVGVADLVQRPRLSHEVAGGLEGLERPELVAQRLVMVSHGLKGGTDSRERPPDNPLFVGALTKFQDLLAMLACSLEVAKLEGRHRVTQPRAGFPRRVCVRCEEIDGVEPFEE